MTAPDLNEITAFNTVNEAVLGVLTHLDGGVTTNDGGSVSAVYGLTVDGVPISVSLNVTP